MGRLRGCSRKSDGGPHPPAERLAAARRPQSWPLPTARGGLELPQSSGVGRRREESDEGRCDVQSSTRARWPAPARESRARTHARPACLRRCETFGWASALRTRRHFAHSLAFERGQNLFEDLELHASPLSCSTTRDNAELYQLRSRIPGLHSAPRHRQGAAAMGRGTERVAAGFTFRQELPRLRWKDGG